MNPIEAAANMSVRLTMLGFHPAISLTAPRSDLGRLVRISEGQTAMIVVRSQTEITIMFPRVVDGMIKLTSLDGTSIRALLDIPGFS